MRNYSLRAKSALLRRVFKSFPEFFELIGVEVGKEFAIDLDDRGEGLAGELVHFLAGGAVGGDIKAFILNAFFFEPIFGFVTPSAIWFNPETHLARFHEVTVAQNVFGINFVRKLEKEIGCGGWI